MTKPDFANLSYRPIPKPSKSAVTIESLRHEIVESLAWMIMDLKYRHDSAGLNVGNYSPELTEAIRLLELLRCE